MAGRPDGTVTALPAIVAGRVHGILELVRYDGRPALTAAQLQFAEQLAEAAVRTLEAPGPVGVNPSMTIAALGERIAEEMLV